jgi:hypothetical protein
MIKCPNPDCGYENVDGTQFCEGCGEELPQAAGAMATAAPAAAGASMVKCPACDNLNLPDNVVCEVCGTELKPGAAAAAPSPASSAPATASGAAVGGGTQAGGGTVAPPASVSFPSGGPAVAAATPDATPVTATISGAPAAPLDIAVPGLSDTTGADAGSVVAAGDTTSGVTPDPGMAAASAPAADAGLGTGATVVAPDVSGAGSSVAPIGTDTSIGSPALAGTPAGAPTAAVGGLLQPGAVKLTVEQGMAVGKQFVLGDPELLVGREDEEEQIYPDIDLSDQDEGYVHRRHATIRFENGQMMVTHLGGVNKTRINNKPIPDDTPQPVNIGDKLSFGKVVMRVGSV